MPKKVFWPAALVVMGVVTLSQNMGLFPDMFWNLWPVILIVVGLGGLITSDNDDWMHDVPKKSKKSKKKKSK